MHRRRSGRSNAFYLVTLFLLGVIVIWLLTLDFENSVALKWMTEENTTSNEEIELRLFDKGQFGVVVTDSIPRWIACQVADLPNGDSLLFDVNSMGARYTLPMGSVHPELWNDYVAHANFWAQDCDSLFVIFGSVNGMDSLYTVNLCIEENSRGLGLLLTPQDTELPLLTLARSIDEVEKTVGLNFFSDLLTSQDENYIESEFRRFQWIYPDTLYEKRINAIKKN